ncbi:hypothetical protein PFICI_05112 [Pestalotiopsis fici W106-1]|uniref:Ecp2 effector protein-like domain-containing protein n=1 Tax=Pestalotiopsis fici (strain W106-1 / CGMCC3.15140) TaxID=1229662 RepID=W3XDJ6_PESFW|nr:uncharacterized protein PFICI_05112 [Pestalotiopsis fici W106-1]ETS83236.1 hypothetical protein PFICI_05112 [Pestalotiopsis fici W106-1]
MELFSLLFITFCFACQALSAAVGDSKPGWITKQVAMSDGSTDTLYSRDTFVHAGIEARKHNETAKFRFEGGDAQRSCESVIMARAPWITPAEAQKCADLGIQILGQPGYWEGWDWPGGHNTYSLARLADCEFGIARVDGLDSQAKFGNLDVGYLLGNVSDAQNGLVVDSGVVQVGGSMRCLGAPMSFTVGKTAWPLADVESEKKGKPRRAERWSN